MVDIQQIFAIVMGGAALGVILTVVFTVVVPAIVFFVIYRLIRKNREIVQNGIPGQATILKVWETGMFVNNRPRLGMELEVRPATGAPYRAEAKMVVTFINSAKFQPGAVIPVRISRDDPDMIVFDSQSAEFGGVGAGGGGSA
ncbi:MAG: hypothetical protein HZB29_03125 [Nitrospinae bacterium]|nr:hypothetical protein [Nitrospinota bacterium]